MNSIDRILIVGAGLAGARAAETLRKDGYDGAITLLGDESERPYLRPPLSKEFLRGESDREQVYVHPEVWYAEHQIDLRPSTAVRAIDPASREIVLDDDYRLPFDRLLLATGVRPKKLPLPGADRPGVLSLRTLADAETLRAAAANAERIVVIGAGWIGSEVAASLRMMGRRVVLLAPDAVPLERVLGQEIGKVYRDLHLEHGVELAKAAGLSVGDGIEVSPTLETSVPGIFAAGDVASAWHPFYDRRLRNEHWANAKFQGSAAGSLMLGANLPFDRIPYFYSDQYDLGMEYTGFAAPSDRVVVRGTLTSREFVAFWLAEGRVVAGMNVNVWDVAKPIERLIRSREVVDIDAIGDPSIPLDALIGVAEPL